MAIRRQRLVEKRRVVVGIDAAHRDRRLLRYRLDALDDHRLLPYQERDRLRPPRAQVGGDQAEDKDPGSRPAQCATKSTSRKPGNGSPQSKNVRTGTRTLRFLFRRRLRHEPASLRTGARRRSIMAALTVSTQRRTSPWSSRCPWRAIASTKAGGTAFKRFPQMRSDASHKTTSASRTALS